MTMTGFDITALWRVVEDVPAKSEGPSMGLTGVSASWCLSPHSPMDKIEGMLVTGISSQVHPFGSQVLM